MKRTWEATNSHTSTPLETAKAVGLLFWESVAVLVVKGMKKIIGEKAEDEELIDAMIDSPMEREAAMKLYEERHPKH